MNPRSRSGHPPEILIAADGRIAKPASALLRAAFSFGPRQLDETRWRSLSDLTPLGATLKKGGFSAITLGRVIWYMPVQLERLGFDDWFDLLCHEQTHRQQIARHGMVGFYGRYLFESARRGYWWNRFELEARDTGARQLLDWAGPSGLRARELLTDQGFDEGARSALLLRLGFSWREWRLNARAGRQ